MWFQNRRQRERKLNTAPEPPASSPARRKRAAPPASGAPPACAPCSPAGSPIRRDVSTAETLVLSPARSDRAPEVPISPFNSPLGADEQGPLHVSSPCHAPKAAKPAIVGEHEHVQVGA